MREARAAVAGAPPATSPVPEVSRVSSEVSRGMSPEVSSQDELRTLVLLGVPGHIEADGRRFTLRRAWPRERGRTHLEYADRDARLAAQHVPDREQRRRLARDTGVPTDHQGAPDLLVHVGGADRRLPALAQLLVQPGAVLVSHVPERRAVVRQPDGSYAKVLRAGRTADVAAVTARAREVAGGSFLVPALLSHDDALGLLEFAPLQGPTLLGLAESGAPVGVLERAWHAVGAAVRVLHDSDPTDLPVHQAPDEVQGARRWLTAAGARGLLPTSPDEPHAYRELLGDEPGPVGVLHRDLHDKQLLAGPVPGMLDLDTMAVGERAVDLANVLAHLDLRRAQGTMTAAAATAAAEAFLSGADPDPDTMRRVPAHRLVTRLRLAGVYSFRPRWHALAMSWYAGTWDPAGKEGPPTS